MSKTPNTQPTALQNATPAQVLQTFLEAGTRGDEPTMRACLTRQSAESGQFNGGSPPGVTFTMGEPRQDGDVVLIDVKGLPDGAPEGTPPVMEMACILVREDGAWKFDLLQTMERMMGGSLEQAVGQMAEAMGEVMQGVGDALSQGLNEAFATPPREISDEEKSWDTASLVPAAEELRELPELTDLPKTAAAVSAGLGQEVRVSADIKGLLRTVGSDDSATLINWFEDSLFADWQNVFYQAQEKVPGLSPVAGVRLEGVSFRDHRLLIADGSTLVYRMDLSSTDGYFSDADLLERLPGILAGLPAEPDPEGRQIPFEEEEATVESYRLHVVPRFMRRIRELLGTPVELDASWPGIENWNNAGKVLRWWGLNRVYGALSLAMKDEARAEKLKKELQRITLNVGSVNRNATFADGTLTLELSGYSGDKLGYYECELLRVLDGEFVE